MNNTPTTTTENIIYGWLLLAVLSLIFAGIFALLVAMARTPLIEDLLPLGRDHIYVALVGHVVLAVVIWFLAFESFLLMQTTTVDIGRRVFSPPLGWASLAASGVGMGLIVISAVFGLGQAELANYVPVLLTPVFYAGLIFFAVGITLNLLNASITALQARMTGIKMPITTFGILTAGAAIFTAFVCFALSGYFQYATNKVYLDFERLFWGGGHILQFANTIAMVTVWVYLMQTLFKKGLLGVAASKGLYVFYLLFIIPAPFIYFIYDTSAHEHKDAFTALMRWGLGPATGVFVIAVLWAVATKTKRPWSSPGFSSLVLSVFVFLIGGAIALTMNGVNTKIPAHYHCVIGAVTIAFMGLFYEIVPIKLGRAIYGRRMAIVQPYLYTAGIILFAAGLYLAGSHGVARKTYGGAQNLNTMGKYIGMSIMGVGGLVAIAGGITFVLNALLTLIGRKTAAR